MYLSKNHIGEYRIIVKFDNKNKDIKENKIAFQHGKNTSDKTKLGVVISVVMKIYRNMPNEFWTSEECNNDPVRDRMFHTQSLNI